MKMRLLTALVGLAISFALPTLAQQKEPTLSEQDRQQLGALGKKMDEANNNNDAAAVAALFTEDVVLVTDKGLVNGREAIEKWYADDFQESSQQPNRQGRSEFRSHYRYGWQYSGSCKRRTGVRLFKGTPAVLYKSRATGQR
jgi:hypothetical protein